MYIFLLLLIIAVLILLTAFICYRIAFYVVRKEQSDELSLPPGKIYEPYRDIMISWMKEVRKMSCEEFCITSFDGLKLYGKYYECMKDAPIELMFHGYRGSAERDLCGGVQRAFSLNRNVLIVDQRTSNKSEGKTITFGINESRDCRLWVDFMISHFGDDVKIILTGISMGAATVTIAAGRKMPENVVGILADCGYTSARDIIKKEIRRMKLPAEILYPFVKLGAKIFGHFDPDETSPLESAKTCTVPALFIHGENDKFVPCEMSIANYNACTSRKKLVTVPGAGHGLSYLVDRDGYINALKEFDYFKETAE